MPVFRALVLTAVVAGGLAAGTGDAGAEALPPTEEAVVEFTPTSTPHERAAALEAAGLTLVDTVHDGRFGVVEVPGGADAIDPGGAIAAAEPTVTLQALTAPDDPLYSQQWHLAAVQAEAAWELTTGAGAVVAVIDSGVATDAPDLAQTSFRPGYDWVDDDNTPRDANGHGTHVAGTIAQSTNNGVGVAGLAHGATIIPLRVLDAQGNGTDADVADAILYAAANGADVINLSLGGPSGSSVLRAAVQSAAASGVTIVAAAGNTGGAVSYPAAYVEVIAVGAVDSTLTRPSFSAYGSALDLVAPGTGVVQQTLAPGGWCLCAKNGTSMAAPHVAAAAALLVGRGVQDAGAIRAALESTARDLGPTGRDDLHGHGFLQAADALAAASSIPVAPTPGTAPATSEPPPDAGDAEPAPVGTSPVDDTPPTVQDIEDACPDGRVPRGEFGDVDPSSAHARAVDCAAWLGLASGVAPGSYQPGGTVTRAQMATFLARVLQRAGVGLSDSPPDAFGDDNGSPHELAINQLAALGIVRGTGAGTYGPSAAVSRGAMATFLVAVHDRAAEADLPPASDRFHDDDGTVHESAIDRLAAAGIAAGTAPDSFSPGAVVVRAQLATFLARTLDALVDAGDAPRP